jgi:hypothetical protein
MATVIIAVANILWIVYVFYQNKKSTDDRDERSRKINLLKTLVLDSSIPHLYEFFSDVKTEVEKLRVKDLNDDAKKIINDTIIELEQKLETDFLDVLLAINDSLYENIKIQADGMVDQFTNAIFDPGINLYVEEKFNDKIAPKLVETKRMMIKTLFSYKGE